MAKGPRVLRINRALQAKPIDDFVGVHGPAGGPTASPFGSPHARVTVGGDINSVVYGNAPRDQRTTTQIIEDLVAGRTR